MISQLGKCTNRIRPNISTLVIQQRNEQRNGGPNSFAKLDFVLALVRSE
jgi:hypothetical protein